MTNEASIMNIQINWIRCPIKILFLNHYPIGNDIRILQFHNTSNITIPRTTLSVCHHCRAQSLELRHFCLCILFRRSLEWDILFAFTCAILAAAFLFCSSTCITKHTWEKSLENNPVSARRCDLKSLINLPWCGDAFLFTVPTKILHLCLMGLRLFSCLNLEG